jgi:dephospho-CoA kinase
MKAPVVIGIAGSMRSGKTTLATMIAQTYDIPVVSFAESLRMEVSQAYFPKKAKTDARFLWSLLEEQDKSLTRPLLQAWGQAKRDLRDPDYWCERLFHYMERKGIPLAVCDDVRHRNEAEWIVANGGFIIRLDTDQETLIERGADETSMLHASENLRPLDAFLVGPQTPCIRIKTRGRTPYGVFVAATPAIRRLLDEMEEEEE